MKLTIRRVDHKDINKMKQLAVDATEHGHLFVQRTVDEWTNGVNAFDRSGEVLLGAFENDKCVAICGLNIDPYAGDSSVGRLRRLYVCPTHRGKGIATALVKTIIEHAQTHFKKVRLYTECPDASRFYKSIGFVRTDEDKATHSIEIFD